MTDVPNGQHKYTMRISRLTIDKLGIRLYDKVSAVLSELIANAYDADAELVTIRLPIGVSLAKKISGMVQDLDYEISISDNGHGMTEEEVNNFYLHVGINRREKRGDKTDKGRFVMGRKGIGKLAPFGICHEIEVITASGKPTDEGYLVSNFVLRLDEVMDESDRDYYPNIGKLDGSRQTNRGTSIILRKFEYRRVPIADDLHRQLSARFGIERSDWKVEIINSLDASPTFVLGALPIEFLDGTQIRVDSRPVKLTDNSFLNVTGWVAYAKSPYKDDAMAGIRIFSRGKLVAQTRDFDVATGFTGEYKLRSYVVGEVHADWLDDDEDLIRSDRQDIIWNSERGEAFKLWGQELVKELASRSETSLKAKIWDEFTTSSRIEDQLIIASPNDSEFRDSVRQAAKYLIRGSDRESIRDPDYVKSVMDLSFSIGPHHELLYSLRTVANESESTVETIIGLFNKARLAEMYSLGQVASERVKSVDRLKSLIRNPKTLEKSLQELIEQAPWIIAPEWTPISMNVPLTRFRLALEAWYEREYGKTILTTTIDRGKKEPDFIMISNEGILEIIEIKRPDHALTEEEFDRAFGYLDAVRRFIEENPSFKQSFFSVHLVIVCDHIGFKKPNYYSLLQTDPNLRQKTWPDILNNTLRAHEDFIAEVKRMRGLSGETTQLEVDEIGGSE